jgi:bifunctional DNA-binding transcriptional regulator/antitoxin component of YhaV-PrlF toxin-antitoxin module
MTATISAQGLIEIPVSFREADHITPGQRCEIERVGEGSYAIHLLKDSPSVKRPKRRLVEVLLDCPAKGWWEESTTSERTTLEPPTLFSE